jgi:hypothetical protein
VQREPDDLAHEPDEPAGLLHEPEEKGGSQRMLDRHLERGALLQRNPDPEHRVGAQRKSDGHHSI